MKGVVKKFTEVPKTTRNGGNGGRPATPLPQELVNLGRGESYEIVWDREENSDFDAWVANLQVKLRKNGALPYEFTTRQNRNDNVLAIYRLDGQEANVAKLARERRQANYAARKAQAAKKAEPLV